MHLHRLRFRFRRGLCYLCRGFLYGLLRFRLRHSVGFSRHPGRCFLRPFRRIRLCRISRFHRVLRKAQRTRTVQKAELPRFFRRAVGFRLALRFQYLVHREFALIVHGFGSFLFRLSPWP